jgi:hypothetical protein
MAPGDVTPEPQPDPGGGGCLGCLGYATAALTCLAAIGISAWRGSAVGAFLGGALLAAIMVSARQYRGIPPGGL